MGLGGWLGVGIVLVYNNWLAWGLNGRPDALAGFVSELSSADQPWQEFFRASEVVTALMVAAVAALGWSGWHGWLGAFARPVAVALGAFAVMSALDAVFNLPCAPTFDAACRAAELQNPTAPEFLIHTITSVSSSVALVATIALVAVGLAKKDGWTIEAKAVAAFAVLISLLLGLVVLWQVTVDIGHGYVQVVQIVLSSLWVGLLAWRSTSGRSRV